MSKIVKKVTSAVALSAIAFSIVGSASGVNAAYTGLDAANKLATMGVIVDQSTNASNYRLGDTITRKELAKVVAKLGNVTVSEKCEGKFADLKSTDWGCKYAEALLAAGYVAPNTNFRGNNEVSKAEALKLVMKARGIEKSSNSNWQAAYVEGAVAAGIADAFSDYNVSGTRGVIFTWAVNEESSDDDLLGDLIGDLEDDTSTGTTDEDDTTVTPTTGGTITVSLSPETPMDGLAPANTPRTPLLTFDVRAGSSDVTLSTMTLEFVGVGDYRNLDEVAVYNSKGEKVSKTRDFTDSTREISFNRDIIVKAGESQTLTIAGKITTNGSDNATYGVKLIDLKASGDVEGGELLGALVVPVVPVNTAAADLRSNAASGKVTIGKDSKLAGFEIKETSNKEDIVVKTLSFYLEGGVNRSSFANLALYADGKEVASDLSFNSNDDLVASIDYEIPQNNSVSFELRGVVTSDVNKTFTIRFDDADDVYVVGKKTGFNVAVSNVTVAGRIADANREVEGSEISVSFSKTDLDEARPNSTNVKIGTLKMLAASEGYTVKKIDVKVTSPVTVNSTGAINTVLKNLKLGGSSEDTYTQASVTESTYTYKDIDLSKGSELSLDLIADIENSISLNLRKLTFDVIITEVKDEDNNETYTLSSTPAVGTILSSNSFNKKVLTINNASFELTTVQQNAESIVLGNQEVVAYRAKVSVGDSDSVKMKKFRLTGVSTLDLDDIIDSATLKIGNVEIGEDSIDADYINFNNVNTVIAAGEKNVPLTVVLKLKNKDNVTGSPTLELRLATDTQSDIILSDSESNDVDAVADNTKTLTLTIRDHGKLTVNFDVQEDKTALTDVDRVVLAGRTGVQLAKMKLDAEYEEAKVKNMVFTLSGSADFSDTLTNIKLVDTNGKVLASGPVVSYSAPNTKVEFKNDFNLPMEQTYAYLVADVNPISDAGTAVVSNAGTFEIALSTLTTDLQVEGYVSSDEFTIVGSDLVVGTVEPKDVTVAANSVAGVTLTKASGITTGSGVVVGTLTIDTENQTFNKTNNGKETIEALLKTFKIQVSSNGVTTENYTLKRGNNSVSFQSGTAKTLSIVDDFASSTGSFLDFATIDDGRATFEIRADVSNLTDNSNAQITMKISSVDSDVRLDDGSKVAYTSGVKDSYSAGVEIYKVFSKNATKEISEVTK